MSLSTLTRQVDKSR